MNRAWVFVLGDIGRSPRMQYHAASLLKTGQFTVNLIGYSGSELIQDLKDADTSLTIHHIPEIPQWINKIPNLLRLPLKAFLQLLILLIMVLITLPRPHVILLQLPPALPTMFVCWIASLRHSARLVYDWHNFAYTLMALNLGKTHILVRAAKFYEKRLARKAAANFCVTEAMQQVLSEEWGVQATVLHDKPYGTFKNASVEEQHVLLGKLDRELRVPMHSSDFITDMLLGGDGDSDGNNVDTSNNSGGGGDSSRKTAATTLRTTTTTTLHGGVEEEKNMTTANGGSSSSKVVVLRRDRPAVVVSSTSWTPDEDFSILLQAAQIYDTAYTTQQQQLLSQQPTTAPSPPASSLLPKVLFIVTGKGPSKAFYQQQMKDLNPTSIAFRTLWLEPQDYPLLLGSADIGVSLHSSSSGLDLPMKVVDMFGSGLPVCALSYSCIDELVQDGGNGLLFRTAEELAVALEELLQGWPQSVGDNAVGLDGSSRVCLLRRLQEGVRRDVTVRWHDSWLDLALPVLLTA